MEYSRNSLSGEPFRALKAGLFALALMAGAQAAEAPLPAGVEKFNYRDWLDCYRLTNGVAETVIVPGVGARFSVFALEGRNILYEDPSLDGLDVEVGVRVRGQEWIQWDGCQPDIWKEGFGHQLDQLWISPYKLVSAAPRRLAFQSAVSRKHKAQVFKTFSLDETRPVLKFDYSVVSSDPEPKRWACYYRMFCRMPGVVIFPLKAGSVFAKGYDFVEDARQRAAEIEKDCILSADGVLAVMPHKLRAAAYAQILSDTDAGWVAATWNDLLLLLCYEVAPQEEYLDRCTLSVFWQTDKVSLEPRGPYRRLKQGESTSCNSVWILARLPHPVLEPDGIDAVLERVNALLELRK